MNIYDAYKILGLTGSEDESAVKAAYRAAAMKYHPDRNPGGLHMMQSINAAMDVITASAFADCAVKDYSESYADDLMDAINAVCELSGVIVEVCGSWVWLSGNTKEHKTAIKEAGYFWSSAKTMWYYRPEDFKSYGRKSCDMDTIRGKYGSDVVKSRAGNRLASAA